MDVEDLRLLDAVAAEGSFSRAAGRMRLSQPSVSARIAAVERAVGAELFARDSRGARLTDAGERYLGYVRRCLQLLEQGRRAAAADRARPTIRVGVPASYAPALAPLIVDAVASASAPAVVSVRAAHSAELRDELRDGLLDLVFAVPGPVPRGITGRHAADSPIVALAAAPSREPRRYAVHSWGADADEIVAELLAADVPRHRIGVVSPASAAVALALHRGHVAVVPRITATAELAAGWLTPFDLRLPVLTARLDYLYSTRHPDHDRLRTLARAVSRALRA
jgi:DNA-binding transcriptional LysR family regulator